MLQIQDNKLAPQGAGAEDVRAPVRGSVLMVDDQPARLLTYEAVLNGLPVNCVKALSGNDALKLLLEQEFAVILLDVQMPDLDGFELARMIRQHPRLERTPIIFITGVHVSELDRLKGYEVGAIDYIAVPVVPEILRSKVAVLLELYQRRNELKELNRELGEARARLDAELARSQSAHDAELMAAFDNPSECRAVLVAQRNPVGAIVDWKYMQANQRTLEALALPRESLIGKTIGEVLPGRAAWANEVYSRVLASGQPERYEVQHGGTDLMVTTYAIGPDRVVSSGFDVTDRKRADAALRESERRYQALLEEAPVAVAHCSMQGRFQYVNREFAELLGYTAEELHGMTWQQVTHPDDLELDATQARRVIAGEIPNYTIEKRYLHKSGRPIWAQLFGSFVFADSGQPIQGLGVVINIEQRRAVDAALRDSEERFRELANNVDQFVWTCDRLGEATWYNDRWYEFTGTTFATMRGDGWRAVVEPSHVERVSEGLRASLSRGEFWEDTFPLRRKDGVYRWFLSRAVPIRGTNGEVVRWLGTNTDVTELRELQEVLKLTDRRKDEFLAMLAHELRNPVAPIVSATEALARMLPSGRKEHSLAAIIGRQSAHLARLLDDLLDVARVTQGRIEVRRDRLALAECVSLAVEQCEPLIRSRGHNLRVKQPDSALVVHADRARLAQCIANLLNNAAKFMDPGGEITLETRAEGAWAVIDVIDRGAGIAAVLLPHVFELFAQGERSADRSPGGLGVGLAVCRKLVQLQGGTVQAYSDGPGLGSRFSIRLPLEQAPREVVDPQEKLTGRGLRVLVVDDNHDAATATSLLFELEGHQVLTVFSGRAALDASREFDPQLVLLDIGMPGMDGYEVARRLRAGGSQARLVAMTGYAAASDRERSIEAGFDHHLAKPADWSAIEPLLTN